MPPSCYCIPVLHLRTAMHLLPAHAQTVPIVCKIRSDSLTHKFHITERNNACLLILWILLRFVEDRKRYSNYAMRMYSTLFHFMKKSKF